LADLDAQAGLHSLVNDGVVEGTEVLVIDLDKRIHCDECEEACARLLMRVWRYFHITVACLALAVIGYHSLVDVNFDSKLLIL